MNGNLSGMAGKRSDVRDERREDAASAAVIDLFRAHHLELVRLALLMTGNLAAAEDLVQDAFEQLHRRWPSLRQPGSGGPKPMEKVSTWTSHHLAAAKWPSSWMKMTSPSPRTTLTTVIGLMSSPNRK